MNWFKCGQCERMSWETKRKTCVCAECKIEMNPLIEKEANGSKVPCSAGLDCALMDDCQQVQWLSADKARLASALKEIYNIRGEDGDIERIVNEALDEGSAN